MANPPKYKGRKYSKTYKKTEDLYRVALGEYVAKKFNKDTSKALCERISDHKEVIDSIKPLVRNLGGDLNDPSIGARYMELVLKMSTDELVEIIQEYKSAIQWRAPETIDRILTELLERSIDIEDKLV